MATRTQPRLASDLLLGGFGIAGLASLAAATATQPFTHSVSLFVAFWALGTVTRIMAFPLYRGKVIAFDSAYYVAAGIVLGWLPGALIVSATLAGDLLVQRLRRRLFELPSIERREWIARALFSTFGNALLLLGVGAELRLLGLDTDQVSRHTAVFVSTPLALISFVLAHYHLSFVAALLAGDSPRRAYRDLVLYGVVGESLLTPLSMVMVLVYQVADPAPFALLAVTVLVINAGFFVAAQNAQRLRERVRDLSVLNQFSRALAHNLELTPLLRAVARELFTHFPQSSQVVVGLRDFASGSVTCYAFDAEGRRVAEQPLDPDVGLAARVIRGRHSLRFLDLRRQAQEDDPVLLQPGARAWLGVPMIVNEEVVGFISAQSARRGAYSADNERLLGQAAGQAAIAVENSRLFRLATVDGLTGLFVRRYFDQRIDEEVLRAERFENVFSILMLDLDDFKSVNDTRGHAAGDRVLRETARVMRARLRAFDIAARYGGEEFVVLLPRTSTEEARQVAERVRSAVEGHAIDGVTGALHVTISIGVATFPGHALDPAQLVKSADKALYQAKAAGKNRVVTAPSVA